MPFFGTTAGGSVTYTAAGNQYFPINSAPAALHGWYRLLTVTTSEGFIISSVATSMGSANAVSVGTIQVSTTVFTEFILNYNYIGPINADSASMMISLTQLNSADSSRISTFAIIDDLTFGAAVGVNDLQKQTLLEPCSPNPATNFANIIYTLQGNCHVNLQLFDIAGQSVKGLLEDLEQPTGRYKIPVDVSELNSGIYFYRLNVNGLTYTEKLVVAK